MNWVVFAIFTYLVLAAQKGLAPLLEIPIGGQSITPQLMLMLAVYVGLFAPRATTMLAWGILGLLVDLTTSYTLVNTTREQLTLIGPYTLGFLAGGYVINQFRSMVFRHHPISMGFLIVVCGIAVELIVVLIVTIRQWYDPLQDWHAMDQLVQRGAMLLYSGVLGALGAVILLRLTSLFGFIENKRQRTQGYG